MTHASFIENLISFDKTIIATLDRVRKGFQLYAKPTAHLVDSYHTMCKIRISSMTVQQY
jgi:hypothetical protein